MKSFLLPILLAASTEAPLVAAGGPWQVVDDGVMGGRSRGEAVERDGRLVFRGHLSLARGGGFSSIRAPLERALDGRGAIRLELRGDGRRYQLRFRPGRSLDGVAWRTEFTAPGEWTTLVLPLDDFEPVFRGRPVPAAGPLPAAGLGQVGFLIADGREGPFRLEVRSIRTVADSERSRQGGR